MEAVEVSKDKKELHKGIYDTAVSSYYIPFPPPDRPIRGS